ncbi:hypothetical protein Pdw03_1455 [Penicillium digitatum]|uniref:Uncharacterized protein n=3 Tax=Penicillium digitatum TaxID=36651 RepID=K9G8V6_PEND2|nr:hypothetical protein PDIP_40630 [Penicillium digitatum Pd1]EKV15403.1 hypothetical protein PDIP_40630 [Penicillium digitatum Pd1]EKV17774.1 hypothetical protein PDIG_13500 [Penicillium digitatum PHI26]QQK46557.1 hypothetical protein Pdw03_1455 [Penicillium digitatum]
MDRINCNQPSSGLDQLNFDSQAFFNGLANLDAEGTFNASNDFNSYEIPELLGSFDECYAGVILDGLNQSDFGQPSSTTPVNHSAQAVSNNLPIHAPYRRTTYDPSIGIAYTPEDTDADKVRKWENLIAQANFANAIVPPSASRPVEEETVGQPAQDMESPNSLFESPRSSSVDALGTPSTTPSTPSPPQHTAATVAPSNAPTNVIASAIPHTVRLPRALTSHKGYAQHVSPFAPVATISPPVPATPSSRELENARSRIQSLAKERNYYQRCLRKATAIDPKTGKTSLQLLHAENMALRRANAKQLKENENLKQEIEGARMSYASLVENYNSNIKQLHRAQFELRHLGK